MTVQELSEKLKLWPQDIDIQVQTDDGINTRDIGSLTYYAAYDTGYVVID